MYVKYGINEKFVFNIFWIAQKSVLVFDVLNRVFWT